MRFEGRHLQNHGFLYAGNGQWQLAPAFDVNPVPDKDQESKTWLSPDAGPIDSLKMLLDGAPYFGLGAPGSALAVLAAVVKAVGNWKAVATSTEVGLRRDELDDFAPAFQHQAARDAHRSLGL